MVSVPGRRRIASVPEAVRYSPNAFGARDARSLGAIGQGLGALADVSTRIAQANQADVNDEAARNRARQYRNWANERLYNPQDGYLTISRGQAAADGYADVRDSLDAQREAFADGLSPEQRAIYDRMIDTEYRSGVRSIGRHAADENRAFQASRYRGDAAQAQQSGYRSRDIGELDARLQEGREAINGAYDQTGGSEEERAAEITVMTGDTVAGAIAERLERGDVETARSMLDRYGDAMDDASVDRAERLLSEAEARGELQSVVFEATRQDGAYAPREIGDRMRAWVDDQESGSAGYDAVNRYDPTGSGPSLAFGRYQFVIPTWNDYADRAGVAQVTRDQIDRGELPTPEDQDRVADVFWADYGRQLEASGIQARPGTVALAHGFGVGAVRPMLEAYSDDPNQDSGAWVRANWQIWGSQARADLIAQQNAMDGRPISFWIERAARADGPRAPSSLSQGLEIVDQAEASGRIGFAAAQEARAEVRRRYRDRESAADEARQARLSEAYDLIQQGTPPSGFPLQLRVDLGPDITKAQDYYNAVALGNNRDTNYFTFHRLIEMHTYDRQAFANLDLREYWQDLSPQDTEELIELQARAREELGHSGAGGVAGAGRGAGRRNDEVDISHSMSVIRQVLQAFDIERPSRGGSGDVTVEWARAESMVLNYELDFRAREGRAPTEPELRTWAQQAFATEFERTDLSAFGSLFYDRERRLVDVELGMLPDASVAWARAQLQQQGVSPITDELIVEAVIHGIANGQLQRDGTPR